MTNIAEYTEKRPRYIDVSYSSDLKRFVDIILVIMSAPIVLPLVGFLSLLIKGDGGPAFYSQSRVGRNGKLFRCWKLRTMVVSADDVLADYLAENPEAAEEWNTKQKLARDPRITKIGCILRKLSLDELAQLWNVLRGDMSIVGPRPMMECQRALYQGKAYYNMRPGLTGYWQISDRSDSAFSTRVGHDERYHSEMSLLVDLTVMVRTLGVMVRGTGC